MKNILIVEDDESLNNGIVLALSSGEYRFFQAFSKREAEQNLKKETVELVILDENLPDGNGLELLKKIRKTTDIPVIILTANDLETDIVMGLSLGADDYITKPFSLMVLRARVEVQFRKRSEGEEKEISKECYREGELVFDFKRMEFCKGTEKISLSRTEQKLLRILTENRGQTLTRETLLDYIWTEEAEFVDENALAVAIKRLRDKLEDNPAKPVYIQNVYGIGYGWRIRE